MARRHLSPRSYSPYHPQLETSDEEYDPAEQNYNQLWIENRRARDRLHELLVSDEEFEFPEDDNDLQLENSDDNVSLPGEFVEHNMIVFDESLDIDVPVQNVNENIINDNILDQAADLLPVVVDVSESEANGEDETIDVERLESGSDNISLFSTNTASYSDRRAADLMRALYSSDEVCDVTFSVGDDAILIKGHKSILASSSEVLKSMFFGSLRESEGPIRIPDATVTAFDWLKRHIYCADEGLYRANISITDQLNLLYLAQKYMLPSLVTEIRNKIQSSINEDSCLIVYEYSNETDCRELMLAASRYIKEHTDAVLDSETFMDCKKETLLSLMRKRSFAVSETKLFSSVMAWVEYEYERGLVDQPGTSSSKPKPKGDRTRQIINDFLPFISFQSMTSEEFISGPAKTTIFTSDEKFQILAAICREKDDHDSEDSLPLPTFMHHKRPRVHTSVSLLPPHQFNLDMLVRRTRGFKAERLKNFQGKLNFSCGTSLLLVGLNYKFKELPTSIEVNAAFNETVEKVSTSKRVDMVDSSNVVSLEGDLIFNRPLKLKRNKEMQLIISVSFKKNCLGYNVGRLMKRVPVLVKLDSGLDINVFSKGKLPSTMKLLLLEN